MRWIRSWFAGWQGRARTEWARIQVQRAKLACLDADLYAVGAVIDLAWRIEEEGDSTKLLALMLLRQDLEQVLRRQESEQLGRRAS